MECYRYDLDPDQVRKANKMTINNDCLKYIEADAKKIPFEDKKFDMVLSFDILNHIPEWKKVIKEINLVLSSAGFFLLKISHFQKI